METTRNSSQHPKNRFLSRVTQVFDFKNRQPSGNAGGSRFDIPSSKTRSPLQAKTNHQKSPAKDLRRSYPSVDASIALSTEKEWKQTRQHTPTPPPRPLLFPRTRSKPTDRSPQNAPITTATVEMTADALRTEADNEFSTWISVEVFARVENLESHLDGHCTAHVPLDVMIVVDNSCVPLWYFSK